MDPRAARPYRQPASMPQPFSAQSAEDRRPTSAAAVQPGTAIAPPELTDIHADLPPVAETPEFLAAEHQATEPGTGNSLWGRLTRFVGLDAAIAFTVLARSWSALSGLLTLALIARFLSPTEQGYYYTFYPLVNLQIIFELGFSVVILQMASHEAVHLTLHRDGRVDGPARHAARLASTLGKALRWYSTAALLLLLVLLPAGEHFFATHTIASHAVVHWRGPWIVAAVATTFTFLLDPVFSFLEGCGYVPEVARARLAQAVTGSALGWSALALHHGLFAPGCIIGGQAVAGIAFLFTRRGLLRTLLRLPVAAADGISWRADIWPFQWRMAISWVCGYFTFQLFTPILFARWGPVEAGRMGMSLNIAGAISAVSIAWMNTKAAPFGQLIALRRFSELDRRFRQALTQSAAVNVFGALSVIAGALLLAHRGYPLAGRLLAPLPLAMLLAGSVGNNIVSAEAMYLRAHKQEKFMLNSIIGALYTAPMVWLLGRSHGAAGIAAGYLAGTLVIGLGFGTYTFQKYRRLWHA